MPDIFSKRCKMTVIEYGANVPDMTFQNFKNYMSSFLQSIFKK